MKKILPLFLVFLLLSSCAGSANSPSANTPLPTSVPTPLAVIEGAEPDLLIAYDGEYTGVFASTGEEVYPCEYDYISRISEDRVALRKSAPSKDNTYSIATTAIGDMQGNLLTGFDYLYIDPLLNECGLFFTQYNKGEGSVILDEKTCEPLLEVSSSCSFAGGSTAADTFTIIDYETSSARLYSISGVKAGNTEPLAELADVSYLRSYDEATGVAVFFLTDESAAFFGGDGNFETVYLERVQYSSDRGSEALIPYAKDGLWGYVDPIGNEVIKPEYDLAQAFSSGLAAVSKNGVYGYIDENGIMLIKPIYSEAWSFVSNYAMVRGSKGEGYLIDRNGNILLTGVQSVYPMNPNNDLVQIEGVDDGVNPRRFWLASGGKLSEYKSGEGNSLSIGLVREGLCSIYNYNYSGKVEEHSVSLIDIKTGDYIVEPGEYDYFTDVPSQLDTPSIYRSDCFAGYRPVHNARLCDLFDSSGNRILTGLNEIYSVGEGVAAVKKGFSWGLMDFGGRWLCQYSVFNTVGTSD